MKTGTGSLAGDILVIGAMIVGGTWLALWFMTSPHDVQSTAISKGLSLTTFLLAQPGLIAGVKLLTSSNIPSPRRYVLGATVIAVFGVVVPMLISTVIQSKLASFF